MQLTKELTVFKFKDKSIRILPDDQGELLYCVRDICDALGIKKVNDVIKRLTKGAVNNLILSNTDTDNNGVASNTGTVIIDTPTETGIRPMAYTDEVGLYDVISRSRKSIAKMLHRQLLSALPALRKQALAGKESTGRSTPGIVSTEQVIIETHNMVKGIVQNVNVRLCRLEQIVANIQSEQELGVKLLKAGMLPEVKDINWRARLNQEMRNVAYTLAQSEHNCWNMLYYEDRYRNHRDIKAIARNKGCRPIQIAEDRGWLPELCAIARGIINGEIVSEYRAGAYT